MFYKGLFSDIFKCVSNSSETLSLAQDFDTDYLGVKWKITKLPNLSHSLCLHFITLNLSCQSFAQLAQ